MRSYTLKYQAEAENCHRVAISDFLCFLSGLFVQGLDLWGIFYNIFSKSRFRSLFLDQKIGQGHKGGTTVAQQEFHMAELEYRHRCWLNQISVVKLPLTGQLGGLSLCNQIPFPDPDCWLLATLVGCGLLLFFVIWGCQACITLCSMSSWCGGDHNGFIITCDNQDYHHG